jgi:hypothetical protein
LIPKLARRKEWKGYLIEIIDDNSMVYPDYEKIGGHVEAMKPYEVFEPQA